MTPVFSIIIPAYNVSGYIKQAIDSCLNQNGIKEDEYEIIIIDDGSTDSTSLIVDTYHNKNNVTIIHTSNYGLSASRNRGIQVAQGEFLLFLDGDDWLHPNALSIARGLLNNCDLLVFPMVYSYANGEEYTRGFGLEERLYGVDEFARMTLGRTKFNITPAPCKVYRTSFLKDNELTFIEGILHEDGPFFIDVLFHVSTIRYIEKGLYYYRQGREDSITTKKPTIRNFEGIVIGQEHTIQLTGLRYKPINTYLLYMNVFQVLMDFNPNSAFKSISTYYRRWIVRRRLFIVSLYSTANLKFRLLGIALAIDPLLLKGIQRILGKYCN